MSLAETYDAGAQQATLRFADMVENAVNGADYLRDALAGNGASTLPELARLFAAIRDAQSKLATLQRECEANLADAVKASGEREPEVPGVGVLKLNLRSTDRWDSTRLFAALMAKASESDDPEAAAFELLSACLPLTASLGWRVTGLKEFDVDPETFRERERKGYAVQITEPGA